MNISVCITSFNQKEYLGEAIDSALSQTFKPSEIIIVDDASSDGSQDLIAGFAARYPDLVRPIYNTQNLGVAQTRNIALQAITGEYLTFLDGDDCFLATKLENETRLLMRASKTQIVYSDVFIIDRDGARIQQWAGNRIVPEGDVFVAVYTRRFPRRRLFRAELVEVSAFKQTGGYDPKLKVYEDYDLRIRLTRTCFTAYNPQPESEHRRLPTGLSRLGADVFLESSEYIFQKSGALLQNLEKQDIHAIHRFQNQWRAELIRRMALETLRQESPWLVKRKKALKYYRRSLAFSHSPGIKFWIQFLLPERFTAAYRRQRRI